jgi:hypothetical protein
LTYSIVSVPGKACGRGCIKATDFWKYKIFEPHLEKAANNDAHPCKDAGLGTYWETETHGFPGVLSITVDLYHPTKENEIDTSFKAKGKNLLEGTTTTSSPSDFDDDFKDEEKAGSTSSPASSSMGGFVADFFEKKVKEVMGGMTGN